jgi:phosphotransacetylase
VHILQLGSTIREIVSMVAIAVLDAQQVDESKKKALNQAFA